jgi:hypothetical protein
MDIEKELEDEIEKIKKEIENNSISTEENLSVDLSEGFKVTKTNYKNSILIIFTFLNKVSDNDFMKFLTLLDKLIDEKIKFALLVDTRLCKTVPLKASIRLITWMKKRKPDIPKYLLGSSVVISSKTIVGLVKAAFNIQKPTSPNILTSDFEKSKKFLEKYLF